jgi:flagellar biosynthesis/type III secretory pathway M-ring protein FliF/YscJ
MTRCRIGLLVTLALAILVAPVVAQTQQPTKVVRLGILASILGVFIGASAIVQAVLSNRTLKGMHAETQGTLQRMHTTAQETLAQMDAGLKQVLDRMDARAEARYRDLRDRLDGERGTP